MPGKAPRQKGDRFERDVVNAFRAFNIEAERVPLSGAAGGSYIADITVRIGGLLRRFELKRRAATFNKLYEWLGDNYGLVVRDDRRMALAVVRLEDLIRL